MATTNRVRSFFWLAGLIVLEGEADEPALLAPTRCAAALRSVHSASATRASFMVAAGKALFRRITSARDLICSINARVSGDGSL